MDLPFRDYAEETGFLHRVRQLRRDRQVNLCGVHHPVTAATDDGQMNMRQTALLELHNSGIARNLPQGLVIDDVRKGSSVLDPEDPHDNVWPKL